MLKLCTMLLLGAFIVYGLDDMKVISADDFVIKEKVDSDMAKVEFAPPKQEIGNMRFTDHIVKLREQQKKEG